MNGEERDNIWGEWKVKFLSEQSCMVKWMHWQINQLCEQDETTYLDANELGLIVQMKCVDVLKC